MFSSSFLSFFCGEIHKVLWIINSVRLLYRAQENKTIIMGMTWDLLILLCIAACCTIRGRVWPHLQSVSGGATRYKGPLWEKQTIPKTPQWSLPPYCHLYQMIAFLLLSSASLNNTREGFGAYTHWQTSSAISIGICFRETAPETLALGFKGSTWGVWHSYCSHAWRRG